MRRLIAFICSLIRPATRTPAANLVPPAPPPVALEELPNRMRDPKKVPDAVYAVFDTVDTAFKDGRFREVDEILANAELVGEVHGDVLYAMLVAVRPARLKLPSYPAFYAAATERIAAMDDAPKDVRELLAKFAPPIPYVEDLHVPDGVDLREEIEALERLAWTGRVSRVGTSRVLRVNVDPERRWYQRIGILANLQEDDPTPNDPAC